MNIIIDRDGDDVEDIDVYWNNIDLFLTQDGQILASSVSAKNNVEILEYTATIESLHKIQIDLVNYTKTTTNQFLRISVACIVE